MLDVKLFENVIVEMVFIYGYRYFFIFDKLLFFILDFRMFQVIFDIIGMFLINFFFKEINGILILIMCSQFWDMYKLILIFLYDFCVLQIYDVLTG